MWSGIPIMATVDGPSEVHKVTAAREVLKAYKPVDGLWPSEWLPAKREAARQKIAMMLEHSVGNS
jgi:acyl-CoA dehydrogenase